MTMSTTKIYFSDFFNVDPIILNQYGAFDVSLVNDLPLFIDPFLLFNSEKPEYRQLHEEMIDYLRFLRDRSLEQEPDPGQLKAWFQFREIPQNWLGFSKVGNRGSALGPKFANSLSQNLGSVFRNFGQEQITQGSHIEKLCLISSGVGRDNISDFTASLIHNFLLEYTETFAKKHIDPRLRRRVAIPRAKFNYMTRTWETRRYDLPFIFGDHVLLTPIDILTREETWISRPDLLQNFEQIAAAAPNDQLRFQVNQFLHTQLSTDRNRTKKELEELKHRVVEEAIRKFPEIIEYYIRQKEDSGDAAERISAEKVEEAEAWFIANVRHFVEHRLAGTDFYKESPDSYEESMRRVQFLKHVIEDKDGYLLFYRGDEVVGRETDFQLIFNLVWFATKYDVNREVNNGRGPADYIVSFGKRNKSLVEFKLASNSQLKKNLQNQVPIYKAASDAKSSITVIGYFSAKEIDRVQTILKEIGRDNDDSIVLIDARKDSKPSASKA